MPAGTCALASKPLACLRCAAPFTHVAACAGLADVRDVRVLAGGLVDGGGLVFAGLHQHVDAVAGHGAGSGGAGLVDRGGMVVDV